MMRARTEVSPRLSIIKRDDMLSLFGEVFIFNEEDGCRVFFNEEFLVSVLVALSIKTSIFRPGSKWTSRD